MPQSGLEWIPVTQEEKDQLGVERNRALQRWKRLSIIASIVSIIGICIGVAMIVMSSGYYLFSVGGPLILAAMTLILVLISLGAVYEGRKYPTGDETGGCFQCWVWFYMFLSIFGMIITLCPIIFTVMGLAKCIDGKHGEYERNPCSPPNRDGLFSLTIVSLIVMFILTVINLTGSCTSCSNNRAFGFKGRNEQMLETQMMMFSELQRQQMQQPGSQQVPTSYQPAPNTYQRGQPVNDHYYQGQGQGHYSQGQGQLHPTAPLAGFEEPHFSASREHGHDFKHNQSHRNVDKDLPPSYSDAMK